MINKPSFAKNKNANFSKEKSRPLREDVADIDKAILKLLLKRHNLLSKMQHKNRLNAADEKFLRESWQNEVVKFSKDAELSVHFFSLMQEIRFLPKREDSENAEKQNQKRDAYNLAPPLLPVEIKLAAPLDESLTVSWLFLAAAAGKKTVAEPTLQSSAIIDFVKALVQMGVSVSRKHETVPGREYEVVAVNNGLPLGYPDTVIHCGNNPFIFFIFLAHYIGRPSRIRFNGDTFLKLADFTPLRHILPKLGARLTHIVPKSNGLPLRVECSGLIPPCFDFDENLPASFGEALLLASPFYEKPFAINFLKHSEKEKILAKILPLLDQTGVTYTVNNYTVNINPCSPAIPENPEIPVEVPVALYLLALCGPLGGNVSIKGKWPEMPESAFLWSLFQDMGLPWQKTAEKIMAENKTGVFNIKNIKNSLFDKLDDSTAIFIIAILACAALKGQQICLPKNLYNKYHNEITDFLRVISLEASPDGNLTNISSESGNPVWNAPLPEWALALALAACARTSRLGYRLGNPGIMTDLWPCFWNLYNSLPKPRPKDVPPPQIPPKLRKRILTSQIATLPEIKEEDWEQK